jgi:multicomponent Na+:H+ antiporter subunit F
VTEFYLAVALFLLLNLAGGLIRIHRGPTVPDRMLAAQLFGTTGIAFLLLLSAATASPAMRDVALVIGLLASLAGVAFVQQFYGTKQGQREKP